MTTTTEPEPTTEAGIPRRLAPCFQKYNLEDLDPDLKQKNVKV